MKSVNFVIEYNANIQLDLEEMLEGSGRATSEVESMAIEWGSAVLTMRNGDEFSVDITESLNQLRVDTSAPDNIIASIVDEGEHIIVNGDCEVDI